MEETVITATNQVITVDPDTRQLNIPGIELVFGVEGDADSERKYFQFPRYVGDNLDLAGCFLRVSYRNANGDKDFSPIDDVALNGDSVVFSWKIHPKVVAYKGQVRFVVCAVGPDLKVKWHTTLGVGISAEGMEPDANLEATEDGVAALIAMVEAQTAAVETVGETWVGNVKAEGATQVQAVKAAAEDAEAASVAQIEAKGASTLATIPGEYTALSEAVDTLTRNRAGAIVCEAAGETVVVNDSSNLPMQGLRIFGRSTQDGTPTPDAPVEIESVENPTITVNEQTLTIPRILPGIPVTSGGNYTDSDGQQWICDEVDLERGVYVQRIENVVFDGSADEHWYVSPTQIIESATRFDVDVPGLKAGATNTLCDGFPYAKANSTANSCWSYGGAENYYEFRVASNLWGSVNEITSWLAANPLIVQYILATPIETSLSETEIAAYRALHSNYPNTTVLNDSGAHMVVKYAADTKLYIDNKIAALVGGV